MSRTVVAVAFVMSACASTGPASPATTASARAFAAGPVPVAEHSPEVCEAGDAAACATAGDAALAADRDRAEALWLAACKAGEARGCQRLGEVLGGDDADLADRYSTMACELGAADACSLVANSTHVRDRLRHESGLADRTLRALVRGCELDDWSSCWFAHTLRLERGDTEGAGPMAARSIELASAACARASSQACYHLAIQAHQRGDRDNATAYFARGCAIELAFATPEDRGHVQEHPGCVTARKRGAAIPTTLAIPPDAVRWLSREIADKQRITEIGRRLIPSDAVKLTMKRRDIARISVDAVLCISELGTVSRLHLSERSGFPVYDAQFFAVARALRYRPVQLAGKPVASCSRLTAIYNQRN